MDFQSLLLKAVRSLLADNNFNFIAQPSTQLPLLSFEGIDFAPESNFMYEGNLRMSYISKFETAQEFENHFSKLKEIVNTLHYKKTELVQKEPTLSLTNFFCETSSTEVFTEETAGSLYLGSEISFKYIAS